MVTVFEKIRMLGTDQVLTLISGATLILWGSVMILGKRFTRKRAAEMKEVALQLAFSFREAGDGSILQAFSALPLFNSGSRGFEENLLTRGMGQAFVAVFDYKIKKEGSFVPAEKTEQEELYLVEIRTCFRANNLFLHPFSLQPRASTDSS